MTPRQARLGVDVFTGLVIASVGLALAALTWRLTGYSGVVPATAPAIASGSRTVDIKPLLALAPFGSATAVAAGSGDGPIRLRAIFMAIPAEASTVLIAGADGKVASYSVGQAVGGGVIEAIQAEQIVLRMPDGLRTIGFAPDAGPALASSDKAAGPPSAGEGGGQAAGAGMTGAAAVRSLIPPELQGRSGGAPAATPGPTPAQRPGGGYVVNEFPGAAVLAVGIRPGDVIERVNGRAINAGTNQGDVIAQATAAGSARIEILRNGQHVSLTVPAQ